MKLYATVKAAFSLFLISLFCNTIQAQVTIGPVPPWVEVHHPEYTAEALDGTTGGYYFLLIDNQDNSKVASNYSHQAISILTNDGIQSMSDLSFDFDPTYQKLIFHSLKIIRDGKTLNKLDLNKIRTLQREESMDRFLYDGSLSAIINLDDVRIGDVIEYEFSTIGYNPVMKGHFNNARYFDFAIPYEHLYYSLISPVDQKPVIRYSNGEVSMNSQNTSHGTRYSWSVKKNAALLADISVPDWYDPYRNITLSDFHSWAEVVDWALPYYTPTAQQKQSVSELFKSVIDVSADKESILAEAIRFVQDDIRYLGFESGLNSHKPHDPAKVFEQRFGDCKDKSYLLCTFLNEQGVEATPLLVNTRLRGHLNSTYISPYAFNHVVVQIKLNGSEYYVDPTISNQGGTFGKHYFPDYGKGLLIRDGATELIDLPKNDYVRTEITETISFDEIGGNAKLQVVTDFLGGDADIHRSYFAGSSIETIQQYYQEYYSNLYPDISSSKPLRVEDDRALNKFTVYEAYEIANFWQENPENENQIYAELYPLGIENYADLSTKSLNRTAPYSLRSPVSYHHTSIVKFPEEWSLEEDSKDIRSDHYAYDFHVKYRNKVATITHSYETFTDHVPVGLTKAVVKDHQEIMKNLSYYITYDKSFVNLGTGSSISMISIVLLLIFLAAAIFIALRIYTSYDPPATVDSKYGENIGGWLFLVAIGLIISPVIILFQFVSSMEFFDPNLWTGLWNQQYWILLIVTLIEFAYNIFLIVFLILLISLFFNRRTSLPRIITIYYAATLVFSILDYICVFHLIEIPVDEGGQDAVMDIARSLVIALIWIPYFNLSNRVRETFIMRYAS